MVRELQTLLRGKTKKQALLERQWWSDDKDKGVWWLCVQVNTVLTYWRLLTSSSAWQLWGSSVVWGCRSFPHLSASGRSSHLAALLWSPLKYRAKFIHNVVVLFNRRNGATSNFTVQRLLGLEPILGQTLICFPVAWRHHQCEEKIQVALLNKASLILKEIEQNKYLLSLSKSRRKASSLRVLGSFFCCLVVLFLGAMSAWRAKNNKQRASVE